MTVEGAAVFRVVAKSQNAMTKNVTIETQTSSDYNSAVVVVSQVVPFREVKRWHNVF